jgi:hypothetical protein
MRIFIFLFFLLPFIGSCQDSFWADEKIEVVSGDDATLVMNSPELFNEGWAELSHPNFWKQIMRLSPDSVIVNIADTRTIIRKMAKKDWNAQSDTKKSFVRDSIRSANGLSADARIYVTTGKSDFYKFDKVYPTLTKGVEEFEKNGVDPWYAQAILMIESPGQLKKSKVGAYGPFQLMPSVARNMGLTVSRYKDEREDFAKSAYGASKLINTICIPEAKKILDKHGLSYSEEALWFRLFVLHVYHAGAMNVDAVVQKIRPDKGDKALIQEMWITKAKAFGNNSQNYTQLALASQLILHEMIHENCDYIYDCAQLD